MQLGMLMRELWGQKVGLAIAFLLALLAATRILFGVSLFPPALERHSLDLGAASTHVLVDSPRSTVIDLREDTYNIESLSSRAVLLGNVMASLPVREFIARRAGIPADQIKATAPLTPDQPRVIADASHQPHVSDILKSPDQYRLNIQANPTVPVLDIYSEAPDGKAAEKLANAAVGGLEGYLHVVAKEQGTPRKDRVHLTQLGSARGGVINSGAGIRIALLVFVLVFAVSCAAVLFITRVRSGWASSQGPAGRLPVG